ncbi:MAG: hypothetical protein BGO41_14940 [Clostridiales bacterium 38-18]|jgi:hypothetical protein|nr:MAG: hypothetical protein BGO41_14940 [Clostridiales bacterium 38-18]
MIDKRNKLSETPFSYRVTKDHKLHISYNNKMIMIIKEKRAEDLIKKLMSSNAFEQQLILAKATGNFKHGNER